MTDDEINPELDLVLDRLIDVPRALVWRAWTEPAHLKSWFAPKPWMVPDAQVELRPGGIFRVVMRSPEGEEFGDPGCILEVIKGERLVWTDGLAPGFRPKGGGFFTGVLTLKDEAGGTRYRAVARHGSPETRAQHAEMGFLEGWGKCLDQLVEHAGSMKG